MNTQTMAEMYKNDFETKPESKSTTQNFILYKSLPASKYPLSLFLMKINRILLTVLTDLGLTLQLSQK